MQGLPVNKGQFTVDQIREILNSVGSQSTIHSACRRQGISRTTFYRWRAKVRAYDDALRAERLRVLEEENGQLKRKVAELLLDYNALRVALVNEASPAC